jgi:hypothetical protein
VRRCENLVFVFNYTVAPQALPPGLMGTRLVGDAMLAPAGVAIGTPPAGSAG